MFITADLNRIAHALRKSLGIKWGVAFRLAMNVSHLPSQGVLANNSVFGVWNTESASAVANHFKALSRGYEELGDLGRTIAMTRVSTIIYNKINNGDRIDFATLTTEKFFGESTKQEVLDFFEASSRRGLTDRQLALIEAGASNFANNLTYCEWSF